MPKPTPQEYQAAIQHPQICFNDYELKNGLPERDALQLPKTISGGFASVFQINCGNKKFAARCFLKDVPDIEMRYKVIDEYLDEVNLPYFIDFEYLENGMLVNGNWLPILKMEWINGETLDEYVDKNVTNSNKLLILADKFKTMVSDLKRNNISHCDLHHGNIMIMNEEIRLLDYDAIYVPELEGQLSNEVGHRNYQHPFRDLADFGPALDNFSEWVIYLSLLALSKKSDLWTLLDGGDECLLFRKNDFESPTSSKSFVMLENINDNEFRALLSNFQYCIYSYDLEKIPSILDEVEFKGDVSFEITHIDGTITPITQIGLLPPIQMDDVDSSWLWGEKSVNYYDLNISCKKERSMLYILIGFLSVIMYLYIIDYIVIITVFASMSGGLSSIMLLYGILYKQIPRVLDKQTTYSNLKEVLSDEKICEDNINHLLDERKNLYENVVTNINNMKLKRVNNKKTERKEIKDLEATLKKYLNELNIKKRDFKKQEVKEISDELNRLQDDYIHNNLKRHQIRNAYIRGIGEKRSRNLSQSGISTAADFKDIQIYYFNNPNGQAYFILANGGTRQVSGIGPVFAQAIKSWQVRLETRYKKDMPRRLDLSHENRIKSKYKKKVDDINRNEHIERDNSKRNIGRVISKYKKNDDEIIEKIDEVKKQYYVDLRNIEDKIPPLKKNLSEIGWAINQKEYELKSYEYINFKTYLKEIFSVRKKTIFSE